MKTITLSDEQVKQLLNMLDCIEIWPVNSRGVGRLYEENKQLLDVLYEKLLEDEKKDVEVERKSVFCKTHPDELLILDQCLECAEQAL